MSGTSIVASLSSDCLLWPLIWQIRCIRPRPFSYPAVPVPASTVGKNRGWDIRRCRCRGQSAQVEPCCLPSIQGEERDLSKKCTNCIYPRSALVPQRARHRTYSGSDVRSCAIRPWRWNPCKTWINTIFFFCANRMFYIVLFVILSPNASVESSGLDSDTDGPPTTIIPTIRAGIGTDRCEGTCGRMHFPCQRP